jgi:hypothetical protein
MGIKYLWDTNTAIYYLQQQFSPRGEKFIDDLLKDQSPIIFCYYRNRVAVLENSFSERFGNFKQFYC